MDKLIARIDYLNRKGEVVETEPFLNQEQFEKTVKDQLDCGRPISLVCFISGEGEKLVSLKFLDDIDCMPKSISFQVLGTKDCDPVVEFVSYTGKYPNLCSGVLTLLINGKQVLFGHEANCNYPPFWMSGGACSYETEDVFHGGWQFLDYPNLPSVVLCYPEIFMRVFNENVEYGCCGGCI